MAVIGRPELVFLDEPTAGLDVQGRRDTWQLITDLRDSGVTVVLTTHAMDEAERLADAVVIVNHGRLVAAGTPAELTASGAEGRLSFRAREGLALATLHRAARPGVTAQEGPPGTYVLRGDDRPRAAGRRDRLVRGARRAGRGPAGPAALARGRLRRAHRMRSPREHLHAGAGSRAVDAACSARRR